MIDRIDDELARSGALNLQIQQSINDAILIYQRERFRFNETFTTTFNTLGGQQNYNIFSDANFPGVVSPQQIYFIEWMTITVPPAVFHMERLQPEEILILTQTGTQMGQPYNWALSNETIMLYPIPSAGQSSRGPIGVLGGLQGGTGYNSGGTFLFLGVPLSGGNGTSATANIAVTNGIVTNVFLTNIGINYNVGDVLTTSNIFLGGTGTGFSITVQGLSATGLGPYLITLGAHVTYAVPASLSVTGNRWMTDAEKMIRSRAKYELAINYTRDANLLKAMSPHPPDMNGGFVGAAFDAYEMLSAEAQRMLRRGVVRPMYF
jgi:hypothetical protein